MDAPGTGENPFPWEPESVKAWVSAVDLLRATRRGGCRRGSAPSGISRGGYSVMQLAGQRPRQGQARLSPSRATPSATRMSGGRNGRSLCRLSQSSRAGFRFGATDGPPSFPEWSIADRTRTSPGTLVAIRLWDLLRRITMPVLDDQRRRRSTLPRSATFTSCCKAARSENAPRGSIPASGHCAFEHQPDWGPASLSTGWPGSLSAARQRSIQVASRRHTPAQRW